MLHRWQISIGLLKPGSLEITLRVYQMFFREVDAMYVAQIDGGAFSHECMTPSTSCCYHNNRVNLFYRSLVVGSPPGSHKHRFAYQIAEWRVHCPCVFGDEHSTEGLCPKYPERRSVCSSGIWTFIDRQGSKILKFQTIRQVSG